MYTSYDYDGNNLLYLYKLNGRYGNLLYHYLLYILYVYTSIYCYTYNTYYNVYYNMYVRRFFGKGAPLGGYFVTIGQDLD